MLTDDGRVVPNFITQVLNGEPLTIYGDGKQTRSFCYIDDLVEGILQLLVSDLHMPVNLGNPNETSIGGLAKTIIRLTKKTVGLQYKLDMRGEDDPQQRCPDISRAKAELEWTPKVSLEEGLLKTIEYFRSERSDNG